MPEMSDRQDLLSNLIARNQIPPLTCIFHHLDTRSLIKCLRVNPSWKTFLQEHVLKPRLVGLKLINKAWKEFKPETSQHVMSGSITDISGDNDEDVSMASFANGGFDLMKEDGIRSFDSDSDICWKWKTSSNVQVGEYIVSITHHGADNNDKAVAEIIIKNRTDLKSIYRYKAKYNHRFSSYIHEKAVFINDGHFFKHIIFNSNCNLVQNDNNDLFHEPINFDRKESHWDLEVVHNEFLVFRNQCFPFLHILNSYKDIWRTINVDTEADNNAGTPMRQTLPPGPGIINLSEVWPHLIILLRWAKLLKTINEQTIFPHIQHALAE